MSLRTVPRVSSFSSMESRPPIGEQSLRVMLEHALQGSIFPLDRHWLVWIARDDGAPRALLTLLEGLPDRQYESIAEIADELERVREQKLQEGEAG